MKLFNFFVSHALVQLKAVCVDIQESESAIITSFTSYYPGCVPVQIINHFPDTAVKFCQESKYVYKCNYKPL